MPITLNPTKATGATAKASDIVYVEPPLQVTDDWLEKTLPDLGMNTPFLADFLSAMLTHERCGRHLYRSVAGRTNNPMLKAKYEEFGGETERHVEVLEQLISAMGGNPNYVSPAARAVEGMDTKMVESTFLLAGSLDVMTAELAMLDAVFLAEAADHANWKSLGALCEQLPDGDLKSMMRSAVDEVEQDEDEHFGWAQSTRERLVLLQAESSAMAAVGAKAEELVAKVRSWLS